MIIQRSRGNLNYLREINCFYDWLDTNPISDSAIVLWHGLMHINNRAGWIEEFTVAISTLETKTKLNKDAIVRARNTLQQYGRIRFRSRSGRQSAIYTIISFEAQVRPPNDCVGKSDTNFGTNHNGNSTQTPTQVSAITKLSIKLNGNKNTPSVNQNGACVNLSDIKLLEPIAQKLFRQSNDLILKKLLETISEFQLDSDVVQECLNRMNISEIKYNPYGYFQQKYLCAMTIVARQRQIAEQQRELEEFIKKQDECFINFDGKSSDEIRADIRRKLEINRTNDDL